MSKDIYYIRHGETENNRRHRHQHYDETLSMVGERQAARVADHIVQLKPDTIFTSPFARARETAEVIAEEVGLPYTIVTSVHEVLRPKFLYGRSHYSVATAWYLLQLFFHRGDYSWDNDEAENMFDVRNRIYDTKDMLTEEVGERIVIVSHSIFIYLFTELACQERSISFWQFIKLLVFVKKIPNTTVVHLKYNPDYVPGTCPWLLISITEPKDFAQ